ncbi:unnamed protein product [Orchesella dallaii]|uniref:CHK kinase-like domain-containing protein n=1 Tax=Orchesella dallaii TaxID=48710 RepID=A0ABP1PLN6_9HEXA
MSPTRKNEVSETSNEVTLKYKEIVKANGINDEVSEKKKNLEGKEETINFLNSFRGKVYDHVLKIIKHDPEEEKLLVLGHGDYWNNNMMFLKNNETNQIIGHIAIDLQVTRYNSPALNLGYYLYTSVKPEVRLNNFHEILGRYFDILKQTAAKLGHPIDISYEELYIIFRKKLMLGFWFALCFTSVGLSVIKDIDISKLTDRKDFATQFEILLQNWIEDHPKEADERAQVIIDLVKECRELSID